MFRQIGDRLKNNENTKGYKMTGTSAALTATFSKPYSITAARTRELNDHLRRNIFALAALGEVVLTAGVAALSDPDLFALVDEVRCFEDFNEDNDPYGEHDFGAIDFRGEHYFWKIDDYASYRVLTIMRADEY